MKIWYYQTTNNQILENCARCVLILYNWNFCYCFFFFFGWPTTTDMVITSYFWNSQQSSWDNLNSFCVASGRYQHEIEAKRVSQLKMAAKGRIDLVSATIPARHRKTRGTEKTTQIVSVQSKATCLWGPVKLPPYRNCEIESCSVSLGQREWKRRTNAGNVNFAISSRW